MKTHLAEVEKEVSQRRLYEESTKDLADSLSALECNLFKNPDLKNWLEEKEAQLRDLLGVKEMIGKIERYYYLIETDHADIDFGY